MWLWLVLTALFSTTQASEIDVRLQAYIKEFGLKPAHVPAPISSAKFQLGRALFFEKALSGNNNISCADCHHPSVNTHDGLPLGVGEGSRGLESTGGRQQAQGHILARNTQALFNLRPDLPFMFWDGRVARNAEGGFIAPTPLAPAVERVLTSTIAVQALMPMVDHLEMRGAVGTNEIADAATPQEAWTKLMARLMKMPAYQAAFAQVFPGTEINIGHVAELIAAFEITAFAFNDTAYDRYLQGDLTAMTPAQKMGMDAFFGKGKCGQCHNGQDLAAPEFHNVGVPQIGPGKAGGDDHGRAGVVPGRGNMYAFRVPTLRNVSMSPPYMHNGAFKTLAQVIEHYDDIKASLTEYKLVNNWQNYEEVIADHDHDTDEARLASLSEKISPNLFFEESEEKAIAEFLRGALTDKRFLARELTQAYRTYARFQLQPAGFEKLKAHYQASYTARKETYYYFDLLREGGFMLRELEQPMRLIVVQNQEKSYLIYRQQYHKEALAQDGILSDVAFNQTEHTVLDPAVARSLTQSYDDMFQRIYTYVTPEAPRQIPTVEMQVIKEDVLAINDAFHQIPFKGMMDVAAQLNIPVVDLFFVPTSLNSKQTFTADVPFRNAFMNVILQRSVLRDEEGGLVTTWAIEFETDKVLKKHLPEFQAAVFNYLKAAGVAPADVGGGTPSPSKTTERILNELFPND